MRKNSSVLLVVVLALGLYTSGCPTLDPTEQIAYKTIVAAKAYIDKTKSLHPECVPGATTTYCLNLTKATAAKDSLIDVVEVLCAGPNFNTGLACDFPKKGTPAYQQAVDKINAGIANYKQAETDLKGAAK